MDRIRGGEWSRETERNLRLLGLYECWEKQGDGHTEESWAELLNQKVLEWSTRECTEGIDRKVKL